MIKIEYSNHRDIEDIYFEGGWTGIMYIDTIPKGGEVKYISDVEERNGVEVPKSKIVQEEFVARFISGETQIRVLQKLPLMSNILLTIDGIEENKVVNFSFEIVNWIGGGAYAQCKITYAINTYVNKNAKP